MSRVYDNWERLVAAVLKREELRRIAFCESFSSSISADFSSRFSLDSSLEDVPAASRTSGETFDPAAHSSHRGVQPIKFKEIKKATKNFQPNMFFGEGGFGPVFKGWIDEHTLTASKLGSGMVVAVNKWNEAGLQSLQWYPDQLNEIKYLSQVHHPNLVKLIGYCLEEDNMILVYEFMPEGSLDNHLFRSSLPWAIRIQVAIGAARGLSYLHDNEIRVLHRDFKTANILLDREFNAKLLNFGGAWFDLERAGGITHLSRFSVSYGYAAPEYVATGHMSAKSNVFGFGVVLLELLSGLRVLDYNRPRKMQNLVEWAKPYLGNKRKWLQIMDTRLEGQYPDNEAYTVAKLALQCVSDKPRLRPTMAEVVVALEQL